MIDIYVVDPNRAYDDEEAARLLDCTVETIRINLGNGTLPGLKMGRGWVLPGAALWQRINEIALEEAATRREASKKPAPPARPAANDESATPTRSRRRPLANVSPQAVGEV